VVVGNGKLEEENKVYEQLFEKMVELEAE
jgi:hypothetical protein